MARVSAVRCLAALYAGIAVYLVVQADRSALPACVDLYRMMPFGDKLGHFLLIGGLAFVTNACLNCHRLSVGAWHPLLGSLLILTASTCEECSQLWFDHRTFSIADLSANFLGILLVGGIAPLAFSVAPQWFGTTAVPARVEIRSIRTTVAPSPLAVDERRAAA